METSTESRLDNDGRWQAVVRRDTCLDTEFVFAVKTTGIYCRPTCPSRRPKRANVTFYETPHEARAAGFRPCRRCDPDGPGVDERRLSLVREACRLIDESEESPRLEDLASALGLSTSHLHREFKGTLGVTPRQYAAARRTERLQSGLAAGRSVTQAAYESGFGSGSRLYASSKASLGMSPSEYRSGGKNQAIRYTTARSELGWLLVAATEHGICNIALGDDPRTLSRALEQRFPAASICRDDASLADWVCEIAKFARTPKRGLGLPLDVRGTAFQRRVWQALQAIPPGETTTYQDIARAIGEPLAHRAVANACGANPLALIIPCHRVLRKDGGLGGYRWGTDRKRQLLEWEADAEI